MLFRIFAKWKKKQVKMKCKYPDRDLSQRLDSSVCRYKGIPYFVRYAGKNTLTLYDLCHPNEKAVMEIKSNDPYFDISTIPLGYYQVEKNRVVYITRRPYRRYKQGIDADMLNMFSLRENRSLGHAFSIFHPGFRDMIMGDYPSVENALRDLRNSKVKMEMAISREAALEWVPELRVIHVFYKNTLVGWIPEGSRTVIVPNGEMAWIVSQNLSSFSWKVE